MAHAVARVAGGAHCQPMASWDQRATPDTRNNAVAQPAAVRLRAAWRSGSSVRPATPAAARRAVVPLTARSTARPRHVGSLVEIGHQELGELLAVAGAPFARVPAQGAPGSPPERRLALAHAAPQVPARRRRPTSAMRRWAARCDRSASAPTRGEAVGAAPVVAGHRLRSGPVPPGGSGPRTACPEPAACRRSAQCPWSGRSRAWDRRPGWRGSAWPVPRSARNRQCGPDRWARGRAALRPRHRPHPISEDDLSGAGRA